MHASNQFSTAHLFYAMVLTATAVSLFGSIGILVAALVAGVWWQVIAGAIREQASMKACTLTREQRETKSPPPGRRQQAFSRIELVVASLLVAVLFGVMMPPSSDFDAMQQAKNSMQQIARAVAEYEAKHQCKLPAVVYRNGKPMHSWRVLILNELGEKKLAAAYRFDEPWDGPNNIRLADFRPWHFQPFYPAELADPTVDRSTTFVHLLYGDESRSKSPRTVVEHEDYPTSWMAPTQLSYEDFSKANRVPSVEQGFWQLGVLASQFRGRVAARGDEVAQIHPCAEKCILESDTLLANSGLGKPVYRYHFWRLLRTVLFVVVALYPLRWLRQVSA